MSGLPGEGPRETQTEHRLPGPGQPGAGKRRGRPGPAHAGVRNERTRENQRQPEGDCQQQQWTPEAIRGLGVTTDVPTLGSIFRVSRWRAYQMARTGEWEQIGIRIVPV